MENQKTRIVAIADICITERMYLEAFKDWAASGAELRVIEWKTKNLKDWREKILRIEQEGPEAVDYPVELESAVHDVDVLITHICPIPQRIFCLANRLRVLGCARSGLENVDVLAAKNRNIAILYCPTSKVSTAADATVGLMLAESRGLARAHCKMKLGRWDARFAFFGNSTGLSGMTVGLIGFGNIGQAVAKRLKGFEVKLMVHDPFQRESTIRQYNGEPVSLPELLKTADFVVVLARLARSAKPLIGLVELQMMKETAFLINTARAGLVDYLALRKILKDKKISGAALDVFDQEPIEPGDPFLKLDNVTLSPHVAGVSKAGYLRAVQDVADNVKLFIEDRCPEFIINPEVLQK